MRLKLSLNGMRNANLILDILTPQAKTILETGMAEQEKGYKKRTSKRYKVHKKGLKLDRVHQFNIESTVECQFYKVMGGGAVNEEKLLTDRSKQVCKMEERRKTKTTKKNVTICLEKKGNAFNTVRI